MSVTQYEKMISDILEGEAKLIELEESRERLLMMLGLNNTNGDKIEEHKRKPNKRDVGLRSPVRHIVEH